MLSRLFCIFFNLSLCCFPLGATPPTGSAPQVKSNPSTCPHCPKQFATRSNLTRHIASAHKKRTYSCKQCSKVFKYSDSLNAHVRTTHEKRTYDCTQCDKKFKQRHNLQHHMSANHPRDIYPCGECEQTFTRPHDLQEHQARTHAGRRHPCPHCNKSYVRRYFLQRHCIKFHGVSLEASLNQQTNPEFYPSVLLGAPVTSGVQNDPIDREEPRFDSLTANEHLEVPTLEDLLQDSTMDLRDGGIFDEEIDDWIAVLSGNTPQLLFPWEEDCPEPAPKRPRLDP